MNNFNVSFEWEIECLLWITIWMTIENLKLILMSNWMSVTNDNLNEKLNGDWEFEVNLNVRYEFVILDWRALSDFLW
jgi:hypothetical protein